MFDWQVLIPNRLSSPNLSSQKISHYTSVHSVNSKLLAPVVCFAELVQTAFWAFWAKCTVNLISAQTSQEVIKCTKTKE